MVKRVGFALCAFILLFMFLPTPASTDDIIDGYNASLLSTSSTPLTQALYDRIEAGDPLLQEVAVTAGEMCPYLWVDENGDPVAATKTSTFPRRKGNTSDFVDHTVGAGDLHRGTDFDVEDVTKSEYWQVALWAGTVVRVNTDLSSSWGRYVLIDHGNGFYTRYAHLGYGPGTYSGKATAPDRRWGMSNSDCYRGDSWLSSICVAEGQQVEAGDVLGHLGTTGHSTSEHAHIELIIDPQKSGVVNPGDCYYAGLDNLLRGGKALNELTWYNIVGRNELGDEQSYEGAMGLGS